MRHRLFTLTTAMSLLLCAATCVLWALSYSYPYTVILNLSPHQRLLGVWSGSAMLCMDQERPELNGFDETRTTIWSTESIYKREWLSFGTAASVQKSYSDDHHYSVVLVRWWYLPLWLPSALFATPPAVWILRRIRRFRRWRRGLCPACGYDVRATPDRCPECGTVPARLTPIRSRSL